MRRRTWRGLEPATWAIFVSMSLAASCAGPTLDTRLLEFREDVLAHVAVLRDGWNDWFALLSASDVVEGVLRFDNPEDLQKRPEEHLDAQIDAPRSLLGRPIARSRRISIYNLTRRRWPQWGPYSWQIQRAHDKACVVFLRGSHLETCAEGGILPIILVSELQPRRHQLESYLYLARLDPLQVANLVAKHDPRVDEVMTKLRSMPNDRESVQSCLDHLRALGTDVLPGVLHAMTQVLLNSELNDPLGIDWVFMDVYRNPKDIFDLLHCAAECEVPIGTASAAEDRWRNVRAIAIHIAANQRR